MTRFILLLLVVLASVAFINGQTPTSLTLTPTGSQLNACQTNLTLSIDPTIAIAPNHTIISRSYVWYVNVSSVSSPLPNSINASSTVVNLQSLLTLTQYIFGVNIIDVISANTTNSTISQFAWAPYAISVNNGTILTSGTPQTPKCVNQNATTNTGQVGPSVVNNASPITYGGALYHVSSSVAVMVMIGFVMMLIDSIFY